MLANRPVSHPAGHSFALLQPTDHTGLQRQHQQMHNNRRGGQISSTAPSVDVTNIREGCLLGEGSILIPWLFCLVMLTYRYPCANSLFGSTRTYSRTFHLRRGCSYTDQPYPSCWRMRRHQHHSCQTCLSSVMRRLQPIRPEAMSFASAYLFRGSNASHVSSGQGIPGLICSAQLVAMSHGNV